MRFDITPHQGAGKILLGMSREEIISILGPPEVASEKTILEYEDFSIPVPAKIGYFNNELQISFNDNEEAELIEISGRGTTISEVFLNHLDLFNTPAPDLVREICETFDTDFDHEAEEIPYSFIFPTLDLAVWRPVLPEKDELKNEIPEADEGKYFWTVAIGNKGYYQHL